VAVGVFVGVLVGVAVFVGVLVAVAVGVFVGVAVAVAVGVGETPNPVIVTSSRSILFAPPPTFLNSNRTGRRLPIENDAIAANDDTVLTVEPTFAQFAPLSVDIQRSHALARSPPNVACRTVKVPALLTLKFIRTEPLFLIRAAYAPTRWSARSFPVRASAMYQLPEPKMTSPGS
jgi:hypothetical protein